MKKVITLLLLSLLSLNILSAQLSEVKNPFLDVFTGEKAIIEVVFNIPQGFHQTLQEEYFGIEVISTDGISEGKTIYPAGGKTDEYGHLNY